MFSSEVPPEITAQCLDEGISFSVVRLPRAHNLWEVSIDREPLTTELAAKRGYHLYNDSLRTTLEVPLFSAGYTYEVRGTPTAGLLPEIMNKMKFLQVHGEDFWGLEGNAVK